VILKNYANLEFGDKHQQTHFRLAWEVSSQLFQSFPWFDPDESARITDTQTPATVVHGPQCSTWPPGLITPVRAL
jgi:hypothetical protein